MAESIEPILTTQFYFVDESGDPTLFPRRGKKPLVGNEGCSNYFMLGLLCVEDPQALEHDMAELRKDLLNDPTLATVPSMQAHRKKTAIMFHAKDDCPEVRREVFKLLMKHPLKFHAVIRDKRHIAQVVLEHNKKKPGYRYHPNHLYDRCASRLFKERLHKAEGYLIHFAKRGSKDRTEALRLALEQARNNFRRDWGIESAAPIEIKPSIPQKEAGLQAVDYFLWALQRLYEREEDRYWNFVWPKVSLIHDVDDTREKQYGVYYSHKNPLTKEAKKAKKPGI